MLDLVKLNEVYCIYEDDCPLLTVGGRDVSHLEQRLLKHIITDDSLESPSPKGSITSRSLLEFGIDFIYVGTDPVAENFQKLAESDEFILLKLGQKSSGTQGEEVKYSHLLSLNEALVNLVFWGSSSIVLILNDFISENIRMMEADEETEHPFIHLLLQQYLSLEPEKKSAVNCLSIRHGSGIVLPLLFVLGKITVSEYAKGVVSLRLGKVGKEIVQLPLNVGLPSPIPVDTVSSPGEFYASCFREASNATDFLSYFTLKRPDGQHLSELIHQGESGTLEFKSTFRWDLKVGKTNNAVERASLKTISGFLNTAGGILLIGVRDDGSIEGIESDKFANEDKFLLHLWTLIRTSLGRDVSPYIQTTLEKKEDRTVCIVKCSKSPQPVFLHQPGFEEEFFIRVGPSSNALDISEALRYISLNFRNPING
jgi:hypothetical protein